MTIEHVALYTTDLERECAFFEKYFGAARGALYHNEKNGFRSCFLTFDGGARLEVMTRAECAVLPHDKYTAGYAHIAVSVGGREAVAALTERLARDGFEVAGEPRETGDGYFESVILDYEGNLIEIAA